MISNQYACHRKNKNKSNDILQKEEVILLYIGLFCCCLHPNCVGTIACYLPSLQLHECRLLRCDTSATYTRVTGHCQLAVLVLKASFIVVSGLLVANIFAVTCDLFEQDVEFEPGVMAGVEYQCGKYAGSLRKHIFREHLGLLQADVPRDRSTDVTDPVSEHFYRDVWQLIATRNTQIYEEVRVGAHLDCYLVNVRTVGRQTRWSVLLIYHFYDFTPFSCISFHFLLFWGPR